MNVVQICKVGRVVYIGLLRAIVAHSDFFIVALKLLLDRFLIKLHLLVIVPRCACVRLL